jgi:hypothetical protein
MSAQQNELAVLPVLVHIGTLAATGTVCGPKFPKKTVLKKIRLINQAALAADDTNYLVVEVKKLDDTVIASFSTKLTTPGKLCNEALVAFTASGDMLGGSEVTLDADTQIKIVCTKNGTGVPTLAQLQIEAYAK